MTKLRASLLIAVFIVNAITLVSSQCAAPDISIPDLSSGFVCVSPVLYAASCASCVGPNVHCAFVNNMPQCVCNSPLGNANLALCECPGAACPSGSVCIDVPAASNMSCVPQADVVANCTNCAGSCIGVSDNGAVSVICDCPNGGTAPTCSCPPSDPNCTPLFPDVCASCGPNMDCIDQYDATGALVKVCVCSSGFQLNTLNGQCEQTLATPGTPGAPCVPCGATPCGCSGNLVCSPLNGAFFCQCPPNYYYFPNNGTCVPRIIPPSDAPGVCSVHGDPHFNTFDGTGLTDNSFCEVDLASCDGFQLHMRQGPCKRGGITNFQAACAEAFAFTGINGSPVMEIYYSAGFQVYIDGQNINIANDLPYSNLTNGVVNFDCYGNQTCDLLLSNGIAVNFQRRIANIIFNATCRGNSSGMCGNFNGNQSDDGINGADFFPAGSPLFSQNNTNNLTCIVPNNGSKRADDERVSIDSLLVACDPYTLYQTCGSVFDAAQSGATSAQLVDLVNIYRQCCYDTCANFFLPPIGKMGLDVIQSAFTAATILVEETTAINNEFPGTIATTESSTTGESTSESGTTGGSTTGSAATTGENDSSTTGQKESIGINIVPSILLAVFGLFFMML